MTDETPKATRARYVVALVRDHQVGTGYGCVSDDPSKYTKDRARYDGNIPYIEPIDYVSYFRGGCGVDHRTIEAAKRCRRKIASRR